MSTLPEPLETNGGPTGASSVELDDVLVWPDGTWVWEDDYSSADYSHKSDDYLRIRLPTSLSDAEVDVWVQIHTQQTG